MADTLRTIRRYLTCNRTMLIDACSMNASGKRRDVDDPQDIAAIAKLDRMIAGLDEVMHG